MIAWGPYSLMISFHLSVIVLIASDHLIRSNFWLFDLVVGVLNGRFYLIYWIFSTFRLIGGRSKRSVFWIYWFLSENSENTSRDQKGGPERCAKATFRPWGRKSVKFSIFPEMTIVSSFSQNEKSEKLEFSIFHIFTRQGEK